jgi:hypothetical protein
MSQQQQREPIHDFFLSRFIQTVPYFGFFVKQGEATGREMGSVHEKPPEASGIKSTGSGV